MIILHQDFFTVRFEISVHTFVVFLLINEDAFSCFSLLPNFYGRLALGLVGIHSVAAFKLDLSSVFSRLSSLLFTVIINWLLIRLLETEE